MDFLFDPTIQRLQKTAGYRVSRQEVVSSNLANVDTPGYIAKEVPFDAWLAKAESGAQASAPVATHPRHMGLPPGAGSMPPPVESESDAARVDGNNVVLEKEMTKMAENTVAYMTEITLISRKLRGIRSAIDESSRV